MDLNNVEFTWIKNKPLNWKIQRVKNHFVLTKNPTKSPEGYPILSLTMRGIVERDISSNVGQLPETYNGYNLLEKGDIVFNPMDLISGWVDCSTYEGLISPSYKVIRPISPEVDIKFYTYYFQTHYTEKIFFPFGEGVHYEYRWGLGTETLKNFPIVVPPLNEQQQIVSFLDTKTSLIDSLIKKTQEKIELLKKKKTSVINEVVTKGLNPKVEMKNSGVEWIGKIPSHWKFVRLKYLFSLHGGKDPKNIQNDEGNYPILGTGGEISRGSDYLYDKPTLLLGRKGTIDKPYLYNSPFWVSDVMYYTIMKKDITPKYLEFLFKTIPFDYYKYGSTQPSMSRLDYESMYFPIPPLSERKEISEYLDKQTKLIENTITTEEKRIDLLKEYRKSLISEVVTGKRKVTTDG